MQQAYCKFFGTVSSVMTDGQGRPMFPGMRGTRRNAWHTQDPVASKCLRLALAAEVLAPGAPRVPASDLRRGKPLSREEISRPQRVAWALREKLRAEAPAFSPVQAPPESLRADAPAFTPLQEAVRPPPGLGQA